MNRFLVTLSLFLFLDSSERLVAQTLPNRGPEFDENGGSPTLAPSDFRQSSVPVRSSRNSAPKMVSPYVGVIDKDGHLLNQRAPARRKTTAQGLVKRQLASSETVRRESRATEDDRSHASVVPSLYDRSDILTNGKYHTIVPKGAILAIPERLKQHLVEEPIGQLILWPDFVRKNRNWLESREVSYAEAKGTRVWTESQIKLIERAPRILVAVLQNGPISVIQNPRISNSDLPPALEQ